MSLSDLAATAAKQHGLMTRKQALAAGLNPMKVSRLVRSGEWQVVQPGVYRRAAPEQTVEQQLRAVCLWYGEGATVSHRSAARLLGLKLEGDELDLTIPATAGGGLSGVTLHRSKTLDEDDCREKRGLPVTDGARTIIDLAGVLDADTLAVVVEEAWRTKVAAPDWVSRKLKELDPRPRGALGLAKILNDCRARKTPLESALEVRVWRLLNEADLPEAVPNYEFRDDYGQPGRIDFAFPEHSLAIECDGYQHHGDREAFDNDKLRTARLVALGWRVMPITWKHLTQQKTKVVERVRKALGYQVSPAER